MAREGHGVQWWRVTNASGDLPPHLMADAARHWAAEGITLKPKVGVRASASTGWTWAGWPTTSTPRRRSCRDAPLAAVEHGVADQPLAVPGTRHVALPADDERAVGGGAHRDLGGCGRHSSSQSSRSYVAGP